jgi:peroxiredoxin
VGSASIGVQVLLAVVFATAGVAKLLDQPGSRRALVAFGVPDRLAPTLGLLVPLAELATAAALILHPTARWGGVAALVLLLSFIVGISHAVLQGEAPDCHCFGQLHSAPAGRGTLIRNGVLAALAIVLVVHAPSASIYDWARARSPAELAAIGAGIAAVGFAALSLRLWLQRRDLERELEPARREKWLLPPGLPIGTPAPDFTLRSVEGGTVTLGQLRARGLPVVLAFVHPTCGPCAALFPKLARWQTSLADRVTLTVVSNGSPRKNRPLAEEHGLVNVLLQNRNEVMTAYRVRATPTAILVTAAGEIGSPPAESEIPLEPLIRLTLRDAPARVDHQLVVIPPREEQLQPSG